MVVHKVVMILVTATRVNLRHAHVKRRRNMSTNYGFYACLMLTATRPLQNWVTVLTIHKQSTTHE